MAAHRPGPVVVGVDGSETALAAVELGAWEAERRGVSLRLVHAYTWPSPYSLVGFPGQPEAYEFPLQAARVMVADVAERVRARRPGLDVRTAVVAGWAAGTLVDESDHAGLVVVGARGLGGFAGLLVGSVSAQVSSHSRCPVVVTRGGADPTAAGPVVVGVDGTEEGNAALGFAFEEAAARGMPLVALWAWWMLPWGNLGPVSPRHYDEAEAAEEARRLLAEAVAGWSERHPDVETRQLAVHDMNPAEALRDASREAGLLVVGRHGGSAASRWVLGSIGEALVRHAECPVAVVPLHRADH
jgi:nucleotide-binding universal stress UspA family protein